MGIIGQRPESGVRIDVERPQAGGPPWVYRGIAATADAELPVSATIDASGEVKVELGAAAPGELAEKIRLLLRSVYKHAHNDGIPPPRKISRWREAREGDTE